ncbi:hypothetical protein RBE51_18490 [Pseudomonas taiwanensis]|uniref:hypothetical protein n=1 Tax=Pseudomonas taiwanensis TaxID=470150 RepID=UPI0028DE66B8|nr:hypothetical protein [Pseudomonas taiwanensis]MDT8924785.1 hypothetical protein [Pseudomonas taiwanensis]
MKRLYSVLCAASMMVIASTAMAGAGSLLKRIDVKSYEGYLQVTPEDSPEGNFDINFIRPAYDYQPTTAGAMVGLIQLTGGITAISYTVDPGCRGEIVSKIGLQQFGGDRVGYLQTRWIADPFTEKLSLESSEFQQRGGFVESVNANNITGRLSKGQTITIKLPASMSYVPGDILVMEDIRYISNVNEFSSCRVNVKQVH